MEKNKPSLIQKNFNKPDERRDFQSHGHLDIVNLSDQITIGRAVFEPGWKWSTDVKPIAGTKSCEASHTGYCISGSIVTHMDSGEEFRINPGEAFHIEPGHDAWVDGNEPCVMLDFTGYENYAKPSVKKAA